MSVDKLGDLLQPVIKLAIRAGEKTLEIYHSGFSVDFKADESPLTAADLASHRCIVSGLHELTDYPIISEESADIPFSERSTWTTYWLVDPLDGTKEFIKRNGDFTVNIALIHRHKPVLGVVFVPVRQHCYFAAKGIGSFKQTADLSVHRIYVRSKPATPLIVAGSRSHKTPELETFLKHLPEHKLISIGSSLKFCMVAEGIADIYPRLGLTSEWDTAAAQCIVEQAGGAVLDIGGRALEYNRKVSLLNPFFLVFGDKSHNWTKYIY